MAFSEVVAVCAVPLILAHSVGICLTLRGIEARGLELRGIEVRGIQLRGIDTTSRPRDAARAQGRRRKVIRVAVDCNGVNVEMYSCSLSS